MKHLKWTAPILALGLVAMPATAEEAPQQDMQQEEASIAFVNHGAIRSWRAADDETVYLRARGNQWYKASLAFPSHGLHYANAIGFDTGGVSTFDKFSAIVVEGVRIPLTSLVEVDGPPSRVDREA